MKSITHLALALDSDLVVATFVKSAHAAEFCKKHKLCHMPFNHANRAKTPCPIVGSFYRA